MKFRIILVLSLGLNCSFIHSQVATRSLPDSSGRGQTITLPQNFGESFDAPLRFYKGDVIRINVDTVYAVNKHRFKFYQGMHLFIRDAADPMIVANLINKYKSAIDTFNVGIDTLLMLSEKTDKLFRDLHKESIDSLKVVYEGQVAIQDTLNLVRADLKQSKKSINKSKFWTGFSMFVATAIGFVLGSTL